MAMAGAVACPSSTAAAAAVAVGGRRSHGSRKQQVDRRGGGGGGGERERSSLCLSSAMEASCFVGCRGLVLRNDRRAAAAAAMAAGSSSAGRAMMPRVVSAVDKPGGREEGGERRLTTAMAAAMAAAVLTGALVAQGAAHAAAQVTSNVALTDGVDSDTVSTAIAGGGAIAAIAAALSIADPEKRRKQQATEAGGDDMDVVRNYFNSTGFDRWKRIYGETDDVNKVQLDIRQGHAITIEKVLNWLKSESSLQGVTVCDVGCGTGSLSIPLAMLGATVSASDISQAMVDEAARRADAALKSQPNGSTVKPVFEAKDLESISGKYHTVACLDVLIHYPQDRANDMLTHIASLAEKRIIISFAPKTLFYSFLKRVGELFPGPSKATRAYLHAEEDVEAALKAAGWQVTKREMTATKFYFSRLLEAVPIGSS